jgi:CheY-like chemotaxis protein
VVEQEYGALYLQFLAGSRAAATAGYWEAAYHALQAALQCLPGLRDPARLREAAVEARRQLAALDGREPGHPLATRGAWFCGGQSPYEVAAVIAERRAGLSAERKHNLAGLQSPHSRSEPQEPSAGAPPAGAPGRRDDPRRTAAPRPAGGATPGRPKVIAFDLDAESLASLRRAFPGWGVEVMSGATAASLARDWDPGAADLLVVGAAGQPARALGLCRGLRSQAGRAHTPLLVLVASARDDLVGEALGAGADSCLVVPPHPKDLVGAVGRARAGGRPGRHALGLARDDGDDPWQDDGGEA